MYVFIFVYLFIYTLDDIKILPRCRGQLEGDSLKNDKTTISTI